MAQQVLRPQPSSSEGDQIKRRYKRLSYQIARDHADKAKVSSHFHQACKTFVKFFNSSKLGFVWENPASKGRREASDQSTMMEGCGRKPYGTKQAAGRRRDVKEL